MQVLENNYISENSGAASAAAADPLLVIIVLGVRREWVKKVYIRFKPCMEPWVCRISLCFQNRNSLENR